MSLFHHDRPPKDPVGLVVKNQRIADSLQITLDPELVYVIAFQGSLMGRRFSAIINTVSVFEFESPIEQLQFQQWIAEYLPTKLNVTAKPIIHLHGTP